MKQWVWSKVGDKCVRTPKLKKQIKDEIHDELTQKFTRTCNKYDLEDKNIPMFKQTSGNHFMKNNNYIEDLMNESNFLRPQNSNKKLKSI